MTLTWAVSAPAASPAAARRTESPSSRRASLNDAGNPLYVKVTPAPVLFNDAILAWVQANLTPGSAVLSDGPNCFAAVTKAGCTHKVEVAGQRKPRDLPQFNWVNTVLRNLETMLSGTYKAFGYAKYADRYLGTFAYRFSRRFNLADLVMRFIVDVVRGNAAPERVIRHA